MQDDEPQTAVVVGGNLTGLFAAWLLSSLGFKITVLESAEQLGGMDRSFANARGSIFDVAFHAIDHDRSGLVTAFFKTLMGESAQITPLKRGVALRGKVFPYNEAPQRWPIELQPVLAGVEPTDPTDDDKLSFDALTHAYGVRFAEFVRDEVIASYPLLKQLAADGAPDRVLLRNIYPWFFPAVPRTGQRVGESSRFHEHARRTGSQRIMYPARGGFGGFVATLADALKAKGVNVRAGVGPVGLDGEAHGVVSLRVEKTLITSGMIVWCAGLRPLFQFAGASLPPSVELDFFLGSFEFDQDLQTTLHEILVGDPDISVDRVSFPAVLSGQIRNRLIQVEFGSLASPVDRDPSTWRERWLSGLLRLGVINTSHQVVDYDFKRLPLGSLKEGREEEIVAPVLAAFDSSSNMCVLSRSLTPRNINQALPEALTLLAKFVARAPISEP